MAGASKSDLARFEQFERIGSGGFGEVFRGWDHVRGHEVALKTMNLDDVADDIEVIQKEVAVLAACRCDNIVRYYACVLPRGSMQLTIAMELLPASAVDLMAVEGGPLDDETIAWIMRGTISALAYLHDQARMNRDLKAANVLLATDGGVKLSDFGVAGALSGTLGFQRATFVGTPYWMAPEVIEAAEQGGYGSPADIWSAGITAIELASGAPPLAELHPMRALFFIPKSSPPRLTANEGHSSSLVSFVEACLQADPRLRPSALELLRHPFVASASLPATLPALVADAAQMCSGAAQRAAVEQGSQEDLHPQPSGPDWDYGTATPPPSSRPEDASAAAAADSPAGPTADTGYTASFRIYQNAAAAESLDGSPGMTGEAAGAVSSATSPEQTATSAAPPPLSPLGESRRFEDSDAQAAPHSAASSHQPASARNGAGSRKPGGSNAGEILESPIPVQGQAAAGSLDSGAGASPDSGPFSRPSGRASPSGHRPLSGWAMPRDRQGGSSRPGSGSTTSWTKSGGHQPQHQIPPPLSSMSDDATQVLQSLRREKDPALAPFAQAASQLFGDKGSGPGDTLPNLGPLAKALLSQLRRDSEQRAQPAT